MAGGHNSTPESAVLSLSEFPLPVTDLFLRQVEATMDQGTCLSMLLHTQTTSLQPRGGILGFTPLDPPGSAQQIHLE